MNKTVLLQISIFLHLHLIHFSVRRILLISLTVISFQSPIRHWYVFRISICWAVWRVLWRLAERRLTGHQDMCMSSSRWLDLVAAEGSCNPCSNLFRSLWWGRWNSPLNSWTQRWLATRSGQNTVGQTGASCGTQLSSVWTGTALFCSFQTCLQSHLHSSNCTICQKVIEYHCLCSCILHEISSLMK